MEGQELGSLRVCRFLSQKAETAFNTRAPCPSRREEVSRQLGCGASPLLCVLQEISLKAPTVQHPTPATTGTLSPPPRPRRVHAPARLAPPTRTLLGLHLTHQSCPCVGDRLSTASVCNHTPRPPLSLPPPTPRPPPVPTLTPTRYPQLRSGSTKSLSFLVETGSKTESN